MDLNGAVKSWAGGELYWLNGIWDFANRNDKKYTFLFQNENDAVLCKLAWG